MSIRRSIVFAAVGVVIVRDDEMTGLARGERERDRLGVAELADHDDVGVLAQRRLERASAKERACVPTSRWLIERALARVHELDGILDREDVTRRVAVEEVDERGERRRLAVAGRAR